MGLWAVHIADGVLTAPWWLGGLVLAAILAGIGAWRIRDEEIPRVALLTAALFVASLVHVPVGPTRAHLLLNGLMGVLLGWRAALAIPLAVVLQTVLFGQGNVTTLGINSCLMTIPALLASYFFRFLRRLAWIDRPWFGTFLVALSCLVWILSLVYSIGLLLADRTEWPAADFVFHPVTLGLALLVTTGAVWAEKKLNNPPEFPLGLLLGELTVLLSVALNCFVLLAGGQADWTYPAILEVIFHLPIAVIEGIVLGFTLGLLARVRPEMLAGAEDKNPTPHQHNGGPAGLRAGKVALLLVALFLGTPGSAWAHRLMGEYRLLPGQRIRVESWFDLTGDSPTDAKVQAFGSNGQLLAEGKLDAKGLFVFPFSRAEPVRIVISAGGGHRKVLQVPAEELGAMLARNSSPRAEMPSFLSRQEPAVEPPLADRRTPITWKDVLLGVGFLLALAAFILSWRNAKALRKLRNERPQGAAIQT